MEEKEKNSQGKKVVVTAVGCSASATAHLEQKKEIWLEGWRFVQAVPCCRYLVQVFFTPEGDSEDASDKEVIPLAASPVMIMPPHPATPKVTDSGFGGPPSLDISDREAESDEDDGGDVDAMG